MLAILCTADKEICADGICNGVETCSTCPQDCGKCPVDGDCKLYTGTYLSQPAVDTATACVTGKYLDENDSSTERLRQCLGMYGGTDTSCSGDIFIPTVSI